MPAMGKHSIAIAPHPRTPLMTMKRRRPRSLMAFHPAASRSDIALPRSLLMTWPGSSWTKPLPHFGRRAAPHRAATALGLAQVVGAGSELEFPGSDEAKVLTEPQPAGSREIELRPGR